MILRHEWHNPPFHLTVAREIVRFDTRLGGALPQLNAKSLGGRSLSPMVRLCCKQMDNISSSLPGRLVLVKVPQAWHWRRRYGVPISLWLCLT